MRRDARSFNGVLAKRMLCRDRDIGEEYIESSMEK